MTSYVLAGTHAQTVKDIGNWPQHVKPKRKPEFWMATLRDADTLAMKLGSQRSLVPMMRSEPF